MKQLEIASQPPGGDIMMCMPELVIGIRDGTR